MTNLLKETLQTLKDINKTPEDISWIGSEDGKYVCTWQEFKQLADKEYDNDYGAQEVASNLTIVFKDNTYLTRWEYDGAEGWEYHKPPVLAPNPKPIKKLFAFEIDRCGWVTLNDLNN